MSSETDLLPKSVVCCNINENNTSIIKISSNTFAIRLSEEIGDSNLNITVNFYSFKENDFIEVPIDKYKIVSKEIKEFYIIYNFEVFNNDLYSKCVKNVMNDYLRYVNLKSEGYDSYFSKEMVDYPYELDYDFYDIYSEEKKKWMESLNLNEVCENDFELAITIDNDVLYKRYLHNDFSTFINMYYKDNFINKEKFIKKDISRIYIGNEFCHNLFPDEVTLIKILNKAKADNINVTLAFTYIKDCYIEKNKNIIDKVYLWCKDNKFKIEIIINDFGMIKLLENKKDYFSLNLGVLLNKRRKDPRYIYKNGFNESMLSENNLNSDLLHIYLKKYNINVYEYESCNYKIKIPRGNHSLHIPFYQTNTSDYCPLYAMCKNGERGGQSLVKNCPKYCSDYVFSYPKHLKMVGRYNSIFAFNENIIKNSNEINYYTVRGINRIVLNFI